MSDEEQIRLLTEIRDTLKEQAAWSRATVKKRGRVALLMTIVFLGLLWGGLLLMTKMARDDARQLLEEQRRLNNPETQQFPQPQPAAAI